MKYKCVIKQDTEPAQIINLKTREEDYDYLRSLVCRALYDELDFSNDSNKINIHIHLERIG